jgi:hypothetical protein
MTKREYIEKRGVDTPRLLKDVIDKKGNIVRPNRDGYYAKKRSDYNSGYKEALALDRKYDSLVSKYGRESEEVYQFERDKLGMHSHKGGLEGTVAVVGLVGGLFFLSNNITGNAIGNLTLKNSILIGAGLIIVGLIGAFLLVKNKRKKKSKKVSRKKK